MNKPELLAPAGDMERLEMALHYGADAVYLGGQSFNLRAGAGNFSSDGLREAVALCHAAGVRAYVTVNTLPHQDQLPLLPPFLADCADAGADALIIADLGVLALAKRYAPGVPLHISTQMGVLNAETAIVLYELGASRVILARELSLRNIRAIREAVPERLELEAFVHGAMCMSISGRCLLSNYMAHRDGNGGQCAQPCRWRYHLMEEKRPGQYFPIEETETGTFILNAQDLCMIEHLRDLLDVGISSLKIEGRAKSAYYAAVTTNAYRHTLDDAIANRPFDPDWLTECGKVSHRPYCTGFYYGAPEQHDGESLYTSDGEICAVVESCSGDNDALLTQRNKFSIGDSVELLCRTGKPFPFVVTDLRDEDGNPLETANHPMMRLRMTLPVPAERLSILRRI